MNEPGPQDEPLGHVFGEDLRKKLHENLELEIDRHVVGCPVKGRRLSPSTKQADGGELSVTLHKVTGISKKLKMLHRKAVHCIVTCGIQCQSTHPCQVHDDTILIEETMTFKYEGQPLLSVELFDSAPRLRKFRCIGKADFILSQALIRSTGWRGSRELLDPRKHKKSKGDLEISVEYSAPLQIG